MLQSLRSIKEIQLALALVALWFDYCAAICLVILSIELLHALVAVYTVLACSKITESSL